MAYDRYDRDERSRWGNDRDDRNWRREDRDRGRDERGFFERAGDEISSWFGDEDAERRRRQDTRRDERMGGSDRDRDRGYGRDGDRDRSAYGGGRSDRDFNYDRGVFNRGGSSERDYNPGWRRDLWGGGERNRGRDFDRERDRSYRPMTGDYGRAEHESDQFFAASGVGRGERGAGDYDRSQTPYGRDDYRRTSFAGSREGSRDRDFDPHYRSWRERHMSDLDRDYDDFQREHQSKFESDFGSWREKRQQKRGLLGQVREHMEVVGKDDEHVGTVDRVAGDRMILTKSDPESGGEHHSLSCSDIDRVEGDRVILDCSADEAKKRWRDESRSRALFEREDQGEMGPRTLNRSFEGTYR
ncbi:MAG TPA: DUF2171 domain-containing protein [Sphingomicrobium sp.]|nr:DUF2171 domain-containing protein [Sphingomicrobium sp.]